MKRLARQPQKRHVDALYKTLNSPAHSKVEKGLSSLYGYEYLRLCKAEMYLRQKIGKKTYQAA